MKTYFPAVIEQDEGSCFGVFFPDFLGCVSAGDTVEKAVENARKALKGHTQCMIDDEDLLPEPTPVTDIEIDDDINVVCITLIPVYLPSKAKRINITLDENLIEQIDAVASNRSAFIAEATRARLSSL
ncbi:MAG: type II toxin-antitoxin system HicB family antitoxin [Alphaproteobacteria bacterium]|nr:type II toxin-antitoxin system HicB family antitoxin [Alphaproteobacteria bacterium]